MRPGPADPIDPTLKRRPVLPGGLPRILRRVGVRRAILLIAGAVVFISKGGAVPPARSKVTEVALCRARNPNAQAVLERCEARAKASNDPVAIWIPALGKDDPDVVTAALIRIHGSADPRLLEPLARAVQVWKPRGGHDRPAVAQHAAWELQYVQGERAWQTLVPGSLKGRERFERLLGVASTGPENEVLRDHLLGEMLESSDPRILPFLTTFWRIS